jgi:YVTN family beta-propeller protein
MLRELMPLIAATMPAAPVAAQGWVEALRADQSGRMAVGEPAVPDLAHPDGDAVALLVRHRAAAAAPGLPGPAGAPARTFVSNGLGDEGDTPTAVAFSPDGTLIAIAHRDSRNLTVFDADTRTVAATIALSGSPNDLAFTPDGLRVVTANIFEDTASIVELSAGAEVAVVGVGDQPGVVRVSPDGVRAVVGNTVSGDLSVIDLAAGRETARIGPVSFGALTSINFESGITVSKFSDFEFADATTLLLPERLNARVQFVDVAAGTVTPLATAANPADLDVSADGTTAVVAHGSTTRLVSVIDLAGPTVARTIATGVDLTAGAIVLSGDATLAAVGVLNEIRIVDLVANSISSDIPTSGVNGLLRTADGQYCLVLGFNGALVSFTTASVVANLNGLVSTNLGAHSPVGPRAALVGNLFTEELLVVNTDGAAGFLEGRAPTGPPPEGDKARQAAASPDGSRAVATNILSDTLSIVDLATGRTEAIVAVGDRPSETAVTPDSTRAVVANLDSTFLSIVDLAAQTASSVPISFRGSQVEIAPDGHHAYAAVVASGDGVWRVNLDTLATEGPKILTGNMGSIFYNYQQSSGLTLSPDGGTLVTCNSFDNDVSIIDTVAWTEVARVPVGSFPVRAVFGPNGGVVYVANKNDDTVSVVVNLGPASFELGTIAVGDQPFAMAVSLDGSWLYVADFADATISVVDTAAMLVDDTIVLTEDLQDVALSAAGDRLYAAGGTWSVTLGPGPAVTVDTSGEIAVVDTGSRAVLDEVVTGLPPGNLALRGTPELAIVPSPHGDGVTLLDALACPGDLNRDGSVGITDLLSLLAAWGNPWGIGDLLELLAAWGLCP